MSSISSVRVPPDRGGVKINIDASFEYSSSRSGIELVMRNSLGALLDVFFFSHWSLFPLAAEGQALVSALQFAISRNFLHASVETDSLQLVTALSQEADASRSFVQSY